MVDDDEVFRERLARAFRERGYEVATADVDEALAGAAESPELAVVGSADAGALRAGGGARAHGVDASTRIVVLTGYGSIATAVEAVRLGATHYLPKPAEWTICSRPSRGRRAPPAGGRTSRRPRWPGRSGSTSSGCSADCGGNISEAARRLGLHRRSLQRKLQKYPP